MVTHSFNLIAQDVEARGLHKPQASLTTQWAPGKLGLHKRSLLKSQPWGGEMAHGLSTISQQAWHWSSIPEPVAEEENQFLYVVL